MGLLTTALGLAFSLWLKDAGQGSALIALGLGLMGLRHAQAKAQAEATEAGIRAGLTEAQVRDLARKIEEKIRG